MTVTSKKRSDRNLEHRQKDKERQRKTEENVDRRPVVAPGAGVRWRGSSTGAPGSGPPTVGFRVIIEDLVPLPEVTLSLVVGKEIQQAKKIPRVWT